MALGVESLKKKSPERRPGKAMRSLMVAATVIGSRIHSHEIENVLKNFDPFLNF